MRKLEAARTVPREEYLGDTNLQDIVERNFQVAAQCLLDIGGRLIAREGLRMPRDNDDVFQVLSEGGIVTQDTATRLQGLGGFRNLLVHDYLAIDADRVYDFLGEIQDFRQFAEAVERYEASRPGLPTQP